MHCLALLGATRLDAHGRAISTAASRSLSGDDFPHAGSIATTFSGGTRGPMCGSVSVRGLCDQRDDGHTLLQEIGGAAAFDGGEHARFEMHLHEYDANFGRIG